MLQGPAPFHAPVAEGPPGGAAHWCVTADGTRVRVGHWPLEGARGTVLLFLGRTEYIEKYGLTATELAARGYASLAIDWRGQGLADRMLPDRRVGHVRKFQDYQLDVAAMMRAARVLKLPRPYFMIGHSMGGAIGLRAVMDGLPVKACVFTGPMWRIRLATPVRPAAWALGWSSSLIGLGHVLAPSRRAETYVLSNPFEDNMLTSDPEAYAYMQRQARALPEAQLGGPSMTWLYEALRETNDLAACAAPDLPCITFTGANERIVEVQRMADRMASWPGGRLEILSGAEHEVMLERPEIRKRIFDESCALFDGSGKRKRLERSA